MASVRLCDGYAAEPLTGLRSRELQWPLLCLVRSPGTWDDWHILPIYIITRDPGLLPPGPEVRGAPLTLGSSSTPSWASPLSHLPSLPFPDLLLPFIGQHLVVLRKGTGEANF